MAEKALDTFSEIGQLISQKMKFEKINCNDFHTIVAEVIEESNDFATKKEQVVSLSDKKKIHKNLFININKEHIKKALTEILFNAFNFSEQETTILILTDIRDDYLTITVVSKPEKDEKDRIGIPMEYENIVFEPFFRLTKKVDDEYKTLNFGLGLTLVEKILSKHGGKVAISNINDYSDLKKGPAIKVDFSFSIPIDK